jgi:hypothetical protein
MKLLLSNADGLQLEGLAKVLASAGIDAEVRGGHIGEGNDVLIVNLGLWVRNDRDYHVAAILCAGFRRRQRQLELCRQN